MFQLRSPGSFKSTERFLKNLQNGSIYKILNAQGQLGVDALSRATPRDTGNAARSWTYTVTKEGKNWKLTWQNTDTVGGEPLVILLQYGHGTGTGGYVAGRDFINPAMKPVFDKIADTVWKEVQKT